MKFIWIYCVENQILHCTIIIIIIITSITIITIIIIIYNKFKFEVTNLKLKFSHLCLRWIWDVESKFQIEAKVLLRCHKQTQIPWILKFSLLSHTLVMNSWSVVTRYKICLIVPNSLFCSLILFFMSYLLDL